MTNSTTRTTSAKPVSSAKVDAARAFHATAENGSAQAKTFKHEELKLVLAYIATRRHAVRNRSIVLTSFLAGMRAHEIASLLIADVVDADGRIRNEIVLSAAQTKGRRARRVFVSAKLKKDFASYIKAECKPCKPERRAGTKAIRSRRRPY